MSDSEMLARADDCDDVLLDWWSFEDGMASGTQVTCDADEVALVVAGGTAVAELGPGRHRLDERSHPELSAFIGDDAEPVNVVFVWTTRFNLPFSGAMGTFRDAGGEGVFDAFVEGSCQVQVPRPAQLLNVEGPDAPGTAERWIETMVLKALREEVARLPLNAGDLADGIALSDDTVAKALVNASLLLTNAGVAVTPGDEEIVLVDELEEEDDEDDEEDES